MLSIDFIVEWICGVRGAASFRVAPATLTFHGVTDLKLNIDSGDTGFQVSLYEPCIDGIERERLTEQKVYLDRPYYKWKIRLHCPKPGEIAFGAVGFTQTFLAEPVLTSQQRLSRRERRRSTAR